MLLAIASGTASRGQEPLPPLSYVCPMPQDADVVDDKPGTCPKCGMQLQPMRLASVWTCPVHAAITKEQGGTCPIDGRRLVQVTMSETWTCDDARSKPALQPGTCPDGSARKKSFSARPHGNHNPQHGGQFFMASDNWHHLEGTYPRSGLFRLYLYDDYTKPLPAAKLQNILGHVITDDGRDIPLKRRGKVLEASVATSSFPVVLHARLKFEPEGRENLFDFTFPGYSKDAPVALPTSAARPTTPTVSPKAPAGIPSTEGIKLGLRPEEIPSGVPELLKALQDRSDRIQSLIHQGDFGTVYVPAFEAKDLALSLAAQAQNSARAQIVDSAVGTLVRDTYLLDAYGDLGNERQITAAFNDFAAALSTIEDTYGSKPQ